MAGRLARRSVCFLCVCVRRRQILKYEERVSGVCVETKFHSISCVWPLIQRSDLGFGFNPPGHVLQSAAGLVYLLFPKIHHRQMDMAVLTHTDFPVHTQMDINKGCIQTDTD